MVLFMFVSKIVRVSLLLQIYMARPDLSILYCSFVCCLLKLRQLTVYNVHKCLCFICLGLVHTSRDTVGCGHTVSTWALRNTLCLSLRFCSIRQMACNLYWCTGWLKI